MKSLSLVQLFATPSTVANQASPSMGFSRQEYQSGLPLPLSKMPFSLSKLLNEKSLPYYLLLAKISSTQNNKAIKTATTTDLLSSRHHFKGFTYKTQLPFTINLHILLLFPVCIKKKEEGGRSQDGGGIGRGDPFLFYKFIERTTEG